LGIYLISAGSQQGLRVGDPLVVERAGRFVARVVVDKVFRDKASVQRRNDEDGAVDRLVIRQGDGVRR
jgi:hypothetical protein